MPVPGIHQHAIHVEDHCADHARSTNKEGLGLSRKIRTEIDPWAVPDSIGMQLAPEVLMRSAMKLRRNQCDALSAVQDRMQARKIGPVAIETIHPYALALRQSNRFGLMVAEACERRQAELDVS